MSKQLAIGMAVLGVLAVLAYGFWPEALPVTGATVRADSLRVTVEEEGQTRLKDAYVVSAPATGYLQRIRLEAGDSVAQGDVLARLATLPAQVLDARTRAQAQAQADGARAGVRQAEEEVQATEATWTYAQAEQSRMERLHAEGTATVQQRDAAVSAARQARARHRAAQHAASAARDRLRAAEAQIASFQSEGDVGASQSDVRAPIGGRVLRVHRTSAGVVGAGTPLLDIGNATDLEVVVDVLSSDAARIEPGMRVVLRDWGGAPLDGRVQRVEPMGRTTVSALGVEEQRVDVVVDLTAPRAAWTRLQTGYRVLASFILWEGADVLQVPQSALFRDGDRWAVFRVEDGRARLRPVRIARRTGLAAHVTEGLAAGDVVITHPADDVADGARVRVE